MRGEARALHLEVRAVEHTPAAGHQESGIGARAQQILSQIARIRIVLVREDPQMQIPPRFPGIPEMIGEFGLGCSQAELRQAGMGRAVLLGQDVEENAHLAYLEFRMLSNGTALAHEDIGATQDLPLIVMVGFYVQTVYDLADVFAGAETDRLKFQFRAIIIGMEIGSDGKKQAKRDKCEGAFFHDVVSEISY